MHVVVVYKLIIFTRVRRRLFFFACTTSLVRSSFVVSNKLKLLCEKWTR